MYDMKINSPVSDGRLRFFFSGLADLIRCCFKRDFRMVCIVFGPQFYDVILELSRRSGLSSDDFVAHLIYLGIHKVEEVSSDD